MARKIPITFVPDKGKEESGSPDAGFTVEIKQGNVKSGAILPPGSEHADMLSALQPKLSGPGNQRF